jgi:hypothetical protein
MKKFSYLIVTISFLTGSLIAVLDKVQLRWDWFAPAIVVGAIGLVIARATEKKESRSQQRLTYNMQTIETSLDRIVENISALNSEKVNINTYEIRHRIDELFIDDINAFIEARQSIAHIYGLGAYADVMSHFAAGERYLNRIWSASADGYIDEVNTYLDKTQEQFTESLDKIKSLKSI